MFRFATCSIGGFFAAFALLNSNPYSPCTRNSGVLPSKTDIEGCSTSPCRFPQFQDLVINIEFNAPYPIQSMTTLATTYVQFGPFPVPVPYDLGRNAVTCNFLTNTSCPLKEGQLVKYTLRMPIGPFFPVGTQEMLEFRVVNESNRPLVCIRVPIRIDPPVT